MTSRARTGVFGTLGAWLRIWTPPRDVEVPPPPRPLTIAAVVAALVGLGLLFAVVLMPAIDEGKDRSAAAERRDAAAAKAAAERRLAAEQRLRTARFAAGTAAVPALERAIAADARARVKRGELESKIARVDCEPYSEDPRAREKGKYECIAVISDAPATKTNVAGTFGYPFWAKVDHEGRRLGWCKTNPRAGEGGAVPGDARVQIPAGCNLTQG